MLHGARSCPVCASLVFGGEIDKSDSFAVHGGSLDEPSLFHPIVAIFARDRPAWITIPPDLTIFDTLAPREQS